MTTKEQHAAFIERELYKHAKKEGPNALDVLSLSLLIAVVSVVVLIAGFGVYMYWL